MLPLSSASPMSGGCSRKPSQTQALSSKVSSSGEAWLLNSRFRDPRMVAEWGCSSLPQAPIHTFSSSSFPKCPLAHPLEPASPPSLPSLSSFSVLIPVLTMFSESKAGPKTVGLTTQKLRLSWPGYHVWCLCCISFLRLHLWRSLHLGGLLHLPLCRIWVWGAPQSARP